MTRKEIEKEFKAGKKKRWRKRKTFRTMLYG